MASVPTPIGVSTYRVTADDLEGLDTKTVEALEPLLNSLNITIPQLSQAASTQTQNQPQVVPVTLQVGATVAESMPVVFKNPFSTPPRFVTMCCVPQDSGHALTTPFVMQGFYVNSKGFIAVPWVTGVVAANTYSLTFLVVP